MEPEFTGLEVEAGDVGFDVAEIPVTVAGVGERVDFAVAWTELIDDNRFVMTHSLLSLLQEKPGGQHVFVPHGCS